MADTRCTLDKQGYKCARATTRPCSRAPTRKRAREHTQICNTYRFSKITMIRESASVFRYTYVASPIRTHAFLC